MHGRCPDCGKQTELSAHGWRCDCGGAWELAEPPRFEPGLIQQRDHSLWRYGALMGVDMARPLKRMGVGWTPLVPIRLHRHQVYLKLEYLSPSGSFKDRGVNVMVNQLVAMGINLVTEDSSGNAGASLAAHAARFGIQADIFVPSSASRAKQAQIAVYGARVHPIPGPRHAAGDAAQGRVGPSRAYASHAYHPAYLAGQTTCAWEIWEQLGGKAPDWVITPTAQGGLFLGLWFGFRRLLEAGLIPRLPRLVAVQAARVAPIVQAWEKGLDHIPAVPVEAPTLAEGAAIAQPVRGRRILQALRDSEGAALAVSEEAIRAAQDDLAQSGYFIEPTSALGPAGFLALLEQIPEEDSVILPLTGTGLKGVPQTEAG